MKQRVQKRIKFVLKSMLWSVLLYVAMMVAFNWDDVRNVVNGSNPITIVNNPQIEPAALNQPEGIPSNITKRKGVIKSIVSLVRIVSGVAEIAVK